MIAPTVIAPVGTVMLEGNVIVSVFPVTNVVAGVNPTVHVTELAPATKLPGLKVTDVTGAALAIVAVPRSTMAMTMAPAVNLFTRLMGLKPDESPCPTTE